jgi:uncharacterized membrane protein YgcG
MGAPRPPTVPSRIPRLPLWGRWAGGIRPDRTRLGALLAILLAYMMVMSVSARAVELEEFTWSAAGVPAFSTWSDSLNWASDTAPSPFSTVGRLSFPAQENSTCALHGGGEECYTSENNVTGLNVESLSIDDGYSYQIKGDPITLGAGGLTATTSATSRGAASLYFPIELGSSQTWAIDGNEDHGGLAIYSSVTGPSALEVQLTGETYFEPEDIEVGPLTIKGTKPGFAAFEGGSVSVAGHYPGQGLNGTDGNPVYLKDVELDAVFGTVGPLTSTGGLLYLSGQSVTSLSVAGEVSLDSESATIVNFLQDVSPEMWYGRMEATGDVRLAGAFQMQGDTKYGECPRLNPGEVFTLVKTNRTLSGTFAGTANGAVVPLYCGSEGTPPTVRINYSAQAVTATAVTPGGPLRPASISSPSISGSTFRGQTLTAVPGTWTGSPTVLGYEWERCSTTEGHVVCYSIPEAHEATYTLQVSDTGFKMRVREIAENSYGVGVPAYSPLSAVVAEPVPVPSLVSPPSIQGSAVVGQTLTEVHGLWAGSPTSYSYQWERCEREQHCSAIPGATGQTYRVQAADVGYTIVVQETAYNSGGPSSPASSPETGIVPPLVGSGGGGGNGSGSSSGGGGGSSGNGGNSGGGGGPPQAPEVSSVSSPIGDTELPGGPVSGGTHLTITGSGFVPGSTQVWIEPDGIPAANVVVSSSTQLTAVTPSASMIVAGKHTIRVNTPYGSSTTTGSARNTFYYYVPQIGILVFRDRAHGPNEGEIRYCTGSVVSSNNEDVVSTAGHCITHGTTWHEEIVFAPGYYGPLCPIKAHKEEEAHTEEALCGVSPYSWWHSRLVVANSAYMTQTPITPEGLDFGFIATQTEGGKHIQEVVGGGLPIQFCQGALSPLHLRCEAGSGTTEQNWVAYGEPSPAAGLVHCGPLATITSYYQHKAEQFPEVLKMNPCVADTNGSSGGPWINLAGSVGAVNSTQESPELTGTYFTKEAEEAFDKAQGGTASAELMSVVRQDAVVSKSGLVAVPVSCPGPGNCRGTAQLSAQGSGAIAAKRRAQHVAILLSRSRFAIHAGKTAIVHFHIRRQPLSRLWPSHTRRGRGIVLATLTLRTTQAVTEAPITLSR